MVLIVQHSYFLIKIFIDTCHIHIYMYIYILYIWQNYTTVMKNMKE